MGRGCSSRSGEVKERAGEGGEEEGECGGPHYYKLLRHGDGVSSGL